MRLVPRLAHFRQWLTIRNWPLIGTPDGSSRPSAVAMPRGACRGWDRYPSERSGFQTRILQLHFFAAAFGVQ